MEERGWGMEEREQGDGRREMEEGGGSKTIGGREREEEVTANVQ